MGLADVPQENGTQGLLVLRRREEMMTGWAGAGSAGMCLPRSPRAGTEHGSPSARPRRGLLTCSHL